ncbi:STAS domain-containing protein [Tenggerimyces flavus]|uniref:STAS domain-containing protein n=1 Tax=Tenggerimyces flavus TaxID=1708749 RepID=A0ABV7YJM2_9ACTN|nr:hypothetical protein [Tenggerimyces flavus]MBM7789648.1 anti-anti-sigma regulatory factor [Tenggerimyces flavus]
MSSMQWQLVREDGVAVVELVGFLGDAAVEQFDGAVGWALTFTGEALVLDLGELQGWSSSGERAILKAAARAAEVARRFAVCGRELPASWSAPGGPLLGTEVFADVASARAALATMGPS